tara:strand:- start:14532 stop:15005 length:474 start_codon:yes stop_codon:yes gene_type:complete
MMEALEDARKELIRVDHLVYVSLKYTRTVDMIKHVIGRLISAYDFLNHALLLYSKEQKKINEIPDTPWLKREKLMELFKDDETIIKNIQIYALLRKIDKVEEYQSSREFRRHVTMTSEIDGKEVKVDIDAIYECYNGLQEFNEYVKKMIEGEEEEDV